MTPNELKAVMDEVIATTEPMKPVRVRLQHGAMGTKHDIVAVVIERNFGEAELLIRWED